MTCFVFAFSPQTMLHQNSQASMYWHARYAIGEDTLFVRKTDRFSRRHIVSPADTLSVGKTHCLLRLINDC